jgi:hypothetical protein
MSSYGAKGTRTPNNRLQRTAAEPELRRRDKRVAHLSLGQETCAVEFLGAT